jgi:hypothetical protein
MGISVIPLRSIIHFISTVVFLLKLFLWFPFFILLLFLSWRITILSTFVSNALALTIVILRSVLLVNLVLKGLNVLPSGFLE